MSKSTKQLPKFIEKSRSGSRTIAPRTEVSVLSLDKSVLYHVIAMMLPFITVCST